MPHDNYDNFNHACWFPSNKCTIYNYYIYKALTEGGGVENSRGAFWGGARRVALPTVGLVKVPSGVGLVGG